jgi:hypothetical protein
MYSFDLGNIESDDPDTLIIFTAFKVETIKDKSVAAELGILSIALYSLPLTHFDRPISKPMTIFNSKKEVGRFVAVFVLLSNVR